MNLKITKFRNVRSTNDKAIKLIQKNGHVSGLIISDTQSNGRGTMGKKWISHTGNIFISIFFKVDFNRFAIKNFLMINAKIIKKILKSYTKKIITIKRPNDLLIEGKKICGILQEVVEFNKNKFLITGIGINTSIAPHAKKFTSTCLNEHTDKITKNLEIIKKIKNNYEEMINDLNSNNFTYIKKKFT